MPIMPDLAGVPGDVQLRSLETAARPPGSNAGVGVRDVPLVHDTHGDLEERLGASPGNCFSTIDFFSTQEDQADLSDLYAQNAASLFWEIPENVRDLILQDPQILQDTLDLQDIAFKFLDLFSPTQENHTDLSSQDGVPQFTDYYSASDSLYIEDGTLPEVDRTNLFSATLAPVPTPAPTPALSFEAPTPMSTFEAPTPAPSIRALIPQSPASESLPPIAIDRAPRPIRPRFTPKLKDCTYRCGFSGRKQDCERHEVAIHGKKRENGMGDFVCKCAEHSYSRKDNLRRHLKTCKNRHGPGHYGCQCHTQFDVLDHFLRHINKCGAKPRGRPRKQPPSEQPLAQLLLNPWVKPSANVSHFH